MQNYGIVPIQRVHFFGISLIVFSMIFFVGCWNFSVKDELKLVIINVLDHDDYQDCHIAGSINIPFEQLEERLKSLSKKDKYVFYCSNYACTAAPFAASMFKNAGFYDVALLPGGIVEWYQKGYPYQGVAQKEYLKEENEILGEEEHKGIKILAAEDLKAQMIQAKMIS